MRLIHRILYFFLLGLGLAVCIAMSVQWDPFVKGVNGKTMIPHKTMVKTTPPPIAVPDSSSIPDVTVQALDGQPFKMSSKSGQPVMLVFFASWCTPCRQEMVQLNKWSSLLQSKNIKLMGVNVISSELSSHDVQRFVDKNHLNFPIVLDTRDQLDIPLNVHTIPVSFLFDAKGKLIEKKEGPMETKDLHTFIEQIK